MTVIVGSSGYTGDTHAAWDGDITVLACGRRLPGSRPVDGLELNCAKCARIAAMTLDRKYGGFVTTPLHGRVTVAELNRRQAIEAATAPPEPLDFNVLAQQAFHVDGA